MQQHTIVIGADHGGFADKQALVSWLIEGGFKVHDLGAERLDPADDYPQFGFAVAKKVVALSQEQQAAAQKSAQEDGASEAVVHGVLLCRSAAGVTIAANKVRGARAVAIYDARAAIHAKEHNNANIVAFSGDWSSLEDIQEFLKLFLEAEFSNHERHVRRLSQIAAFESKESV